MMLADLMNPDALFKELSSTVAEDPFPLIDSGPLINSGAQKHPLLPDLDTSSSSEQPPPSKRMRTSSSRRITCKARGLSNDHNSDNAYLEIASDDPHGMLLSCSHPECADSGRRFRYCKGKKLLNVLLLFSKCPRPKRLTVVSSLL